MLKQAELLQKIFLLALLLLTAAQLTYLVCIVAETYIAGPVQDSWGILPYIQKTLASGNWFNNELWLPQNSHRIVLLRLEFLMDYSFFNGSNIFLISLSWLFIAVEIVLLAWALNFQKRIDATQWTILLAATTFIIYPTLAWSFLHIFNIHMLQCAVLALLSCVLMSKALSENNNTLFIAGILAAILTNFASFSISTIWPALILLLLLNKIDKYRSGILLVIAVIFSYIYFYGLPNHHQNQQSILSPLAGLTASGQNVFFSPQAYLWLFQHLLAYLSLLPRQHLFLQLFTLTTLIWFVYACYRAMKYTSGQDEKTALALMFFSICFGLTTGIGRGAMEDLSTGDRFQPLALIYWAGFVIHLLHFCSQHHKKFLFNFCTLAIIGLISTTVLINVQSMSKKLSEDYTRFAKMQMAYLSNNLGENAIYENMVAAWRQHSYAGIVDLIPYLRDNQLGVFNTPLARYIEQNKHPDLVNNDSCVQGNLLEKLRNNDPRIRNITFESGHALDAETYPYLAIYTNNDLNGIAFRKRSILPGIFHHNTRGKSIWLGITQVPTSAGNTTLIALSKDTVSCRVVINKIVSVEAVSPD